MVYQLPAMTQGDNQFITISDLAYRAEYCAFATEHIPDLHFGASQDAYQCLPRYRYTPKGERIDNVTDWALNLFRKRYGKSVTKDAIFRYVYAALHDPLWRERYAINLRREFPRLPFHDDFRRWAAWGERLMALHVGYEGVEPWPLERVDTGEAPGAPVLRSDPATGTIRVDGRTTLRGIPPEAWDYRLGNRSGLDWVLDQHRERRVRDRTVEAWLKDNPDARYRFAPHKERVVALLARVARVSVETVGIVGEMRVLREAEG